jgi:transketolase
VKLLPTPAYKLGDSVATRKPTALALAALGSIDRRVVALDADVKNSTFSERFEKVHPRSLLRNVHRRAGDDRRRHGAGRARRHRLSSSFACFLERGSDFIRMAGISNVNVKLAGSHAGVSIGEDGPSQMALEDLAMFRGVPNCPCSIPATR